MIVRKDLVRQFRGQYPVPTYVVEFLLGRYCATTDEQGNRRRAGDRAQAAVDREPCGPARRNCSSRARARRASVKIIDIITARLDAKTDCYLATLPSLQLKDVSIDDKLVRENERMLTGGFYAEVDLGYDATIAQEKGGGRSRSNAVRPIQLSTRGMLDKIIEGPRTSSRPPSGRTSCCAASGLEPQR